MLRRFVSIIIPCFNGGSFVADAIESALSQTYPYKEVIVVDDGSTDNSLSVIQGFGERIRWVTGPNRGGCEARNTGLTLAAGDLIQFLDADDVLHPDKLALQVPFYSDPSVDLVYSDWTVCSLGEPHRSIRCRVIPRSQDPVLLALDPQNIQTDSPLHTKSSLLRVGGFRDRLPCCQERELILRLACAGIHFRYFPKTLHTVRMHPLGVSADEVRMGQWMKLVLAEHYERLKTRNELSATRSRAFGKLMMRQARAQFRLGNRDLAWECVQTALGMDRIGTGAAYKLPGYVVYKAFGPERAESVLLLWRRFVIAWRRRTGRLGPTR